MGTTSKGIIYPDPSGVPRRQDLQDLATSADTAIPSIQSGTSTSVTVAGGASGTVTVTFPTPFASTPVVVGVSNQQWFSTAASGVTATDATFAIRNIGSTNPVAGFVRWIAHGS